jgi:hypothetical protein
MTYSKNILRNCLNYIHYSDLRTSLPAASREQEFKIYVVIETINLDLILKSKIVKPCLVFVEIESFGIKL